MYLMLKRLQVRRRLRRSRAVGSAMATPSAKSSGVDVSRLVASSVLWRASARAWRRASTASNNWLSIPCGVRAAVLSRPDSAAQRRSGLRAAAGRRTQSSSALVDVSSAERAAGSFLCAWFSVVVL